MIREDRVVPRAHEDHHVELPKTTLPWLFLVALSLAVLAVGIYAFTKQTMGGFILTGMRNQGYGGAAWGLYIVFDVFYVGVSFAGITVAAIARLFQIQVLKPVTRMAELLTITALLAGGCVVMADLGRPGIGLINLPEFANPSSPFYGTFTLVIAGYLFSSLVYFFLAGRPDAAAVAQNPAQPGRIFYKIWASGYTDLPVQRQRHQKVSFWLALTILPLLVTAHSTLGFIFGLQSGRPGWFSALQAPGFVILAGVSGTGLLIFFGLVFRRLFRLHQQIPDESFRWLGNLLWILALVYFYFTVADELTGTYAAPEMDRHVAHSIVTGRFAFLFWTFAGALLLTIVIPLILFLRNKASMVAIAIAGLLANVAAVCKRFLIVVPSQIEGSLLPIERSRLAYHPTWIEYAVVIGLAGFMIGMMLVFGRYFPLVPAAHAPPPGNPGKDMRRTLATVVTATAAMAMIVVGLTDSFRMWSGDEFDPRIHFSPVIFAFGVMTLFISAIVYEAFPERPQDPRELWRAQKVAQRAGALPWDVVQTGFAPVVGPAPAVNVGEYRSMLRLALDAEQAAEKGDPIRAREAARRLAAAARQLAKS